MKGLYYKKIISFLVLSVSILITCEKPERVASIKTVDVTDTDISYNSAILKGDLVDLGSEPIEDYGIIVSENASFLDPVPKSGSGTAKKGVFQIEFTGLIKNTTYYYKAYVTVNSSPIYGESKSFKTKDTQPPTVTAGSVSALTMTSASLNGEVTSDGGESAVVRGLCWGSEANPTITDCIDTTKNGSGTGVFTGSMTELTPGTQYYARTYATNSKGTSYNSADVVFTTHGLPVVTTASVTDITETTATSGGEVTDEGGVEADARGVCWSTTTGPTVDLTTKTSDGTGEGVFTSSVTGLTQGTLYYLRAYATNQYGTSYGSEKLFTTTSTTGTPSATTGSVTSIASTSATLNGTVNANGYSTTVTFEYGLTTSYGSEVTADQSPVTGTTATAVSADITGLSEETTYHYRVKAVSTEGTTYGGDMELTTSTTLPAISDYDGNEYNIITIGTQEWIQENLKTTHYNNGEIIANITDNTEWSGLTSGAYCWYDNDEGTYKDTYGALYNWYTTVDVRNVCPAGWHVPTDAEWTILTDYLGGESVAGGKLKEAGTAHWTSPNTGATNETGFTALPGGIRYYSSSYGNIGINGYWWSSTEHSTTYTYAWHRYVHYNYSDVNRVNNLKESGFSVRCLKGELPLTQAEDATAVTATSATLNGQVNPNNASTTVTFEYGLTASYGSEVTASESPVTGTTPVSVGAGISGLSESATYHYRVKAVNSYGTTYSTDMTFIVTAPDQVTDIDGNTYNTVVIGSQIWMTENLKTKHYADGSPLVDGTGVGEIYNDVTTKYWFVYDDIESNAVTYGRLYTWATVMNGASSSVSNPSGVQGVCPTGWHVPSLSEWTQLIDYLGGESIAGGPLKEEGNTHWLYSNVGATNASGFTGLPHGYRNDDGNFYGMGTYGAYSTSTAENSYSHRAIMLRTENTEAYSGNYERDDAKAIRCVKD